MTNFLFGIVQHRAYAYKDYLPLLQEWDLYLMQTFVENRSESSDLKCLNFVQNIFKRPLLLISIATMDGHIISHQVFESQVGNGLIDYIHLPKYHITLQLSFIIFLKKALNKCFIHQLLLPRN